MSLEYAILGFLNYHPLSGYDLKKVFDNSVRHFWPADQSQIYRTLTRLTEHGWVEMLVIEQTERPDRKVYHITETGREEFLHWLAGPTPIPDPRSAALIQVFFMGQMTDETILAKFTDYAHTVRTILKGYEQLSRELAASMPDLTSKREHYFWFLTLDLGIRSMQAHLAWAENVIEQLKNGDVPHEG
jgi:PadR family transcriptional regulator, regulatory protein AphA